MRMSRYLRVPVTTLQVRAPGSGSMERQGAECQAALVGWNVIMLLLSTDAPGNSARRCPAPRTNRNAVPLHREWGHPI